MYSSYNEVYDAIAEFREAHGNRYNIYVVELQSYKVPQYTVVRDLTYDEFRRIQQSASCDEDIEDGACLVGIIYPRRTDVGSMVPGYASVIGRIILKNSGIGIGDKELKESLDRGEKEWNDDYLKMFRMKLIVECHIQPSEIDRMKPHEIVEMLAHYSAYCKLMEQEREKERKNNMRKRVPGMDSAMSRNQGVTLRTEMDKTIVATPPENRKDLAPDKLQPKADIGKFALGQAVIDFLRDSDYTGGA